MRVLIVVGVLLLGLIAAEMSQSWVVAWLGYLLAGLIAVALWVTRKPAKLVSAGRTVGRHYVTIGESTSVNVTVSWDSATGPGWILIEDALPEHLDSVTPSGYLTALGADTGTAFSYRVTGRRRGYYRIGPVTVTVGDLFGFRQVSEKGSDAAYLTVVPQIVPVPALRIPSNRPIGDTRSTKRMYEDTTRIVGVRDYAPGDTYSRIHWKTTARTGALATKMCEPSTSVEVNLLLNLFYGDYPGPGAEVELACATAASVAASLLADKHHVGLQTNGFDAAWHYHTDLKRACFSLKPDKGPQQRASILSTIGRLELSDGLPLAKYLTQIHAFLPWTATTLVVTHALSEQAALMLDGLKRSGFELGVIIVGSGEPADLARMRVAALGIPVALVQKVKGLGDLEFWRPGLP